ncbi:hypothetical protein SanaruYs_04950 [Chryseotalea sanaruensis]|uniref:Uncharacterized protein n=1 Tax=Chryseotalea sanaruensis TaxID=2482724 RepID=A0A401U608_9BACT|nr:hypothetical protein SanaruYs_04950 [Chryseotalea sanaruensis]
MPIGFKINLSEAYVSKYDAKKKQQSDDPSYWIGLPDVSDNFGGINQIIHCNKVETS